MVLSSIFAKFFFFIIDHRGGMGTYILTIIYVVAFLANITSEIVYYKRYENFKKSLGYINLKGNKFCEFFFT